MFLLQVSNVKGVGFFPSISVKLYSIPNCAAVYIFPVLTITLESNANALIALPINSGDSELDKSKYPFPFKTDSVLTNPGYLDIRILLQHYTF